MQYLINTWDDQKEESKEIVLNCTTIDEAIHDAVEIKQLNPKMKVKLYVREHPEAYLIKHVTTIDLTPEQLQPSYSIR
jgi:uncharacterized protein YbgA (DUF1722 family)